MNEYNPQAAGAKGGKRTVERHGKQHFSDLGKVGGKKLSERYGKNYMREIGSRGGKKTQALVKQAKEALPQPRVIGRWVCLTCNKELGRQAVFQDEDFGQLIAPICPDHRDEVTALVVPREEGEGERLVWRKEWFEGNPK